MSKCLVLMVWECVIFGGEPVSRTKFKVEGKKITNCESEVTRDGK